MSGGITQLVAIGAQDSHIVGNPEISFFRSSFKRHTNFSSVIERQVIQNSPANNSLSSVRFERKGDLLSYTYFVMTNGEGTPLPMDWSTVVDKVELYIGGQLIDSQDYDFSTKVYSDVMAPSLSRSTLGPQPSGNLASSYFYPLKFWFCENYQSALPLVALQYHDVEMRIYWGSNISPYAADVAAKLAIYTAAVNTVIANVNGGAPPANPAAAHAAYLADGSFAAAQLAADDLITSLALAGVTVTKQGTVFPNADQITGDLFSFQGGTSSSVSFGNNAVSKATTKPSSWSRFVYLDSDERGMLASSTSEYLIHQVQRIPASNDKRMDLTFNHPVKFIATTSVDAGTNNTVLLQMNGVDVGEAKNPVPHYRQVSSYYHTVSGVDSSGNKSDGFESVTMMIPFCLDASKLQPTGSCNFSRLDSSRLILSGGTFASPVWAVNYNILRIQNGLGGLLYAN